MASLTPPCGSEKRRASIASLMPRSGIADPREQLRGLDLEAGALDGGGEVLRVLQLVGDRAARCLASSTALLLLDVVG